MKLRENFNPSCFLSALGAGGLAVSFFMYLMFLVPHKKTPLATFNYIYPELLKGTYLSYIIAISLIFLILFSLLHFKLLIFNTKQYLLFKTSSNFNKLINSNSYISLITIPLTFTMTLNVCFILCSVFIPDFWSIIEYIFPFALLGFSVLGFYTLKIVLEYLTKILTNSIENNLKKNDLSQMISIFALSMVSVGFAAPAAMSSNITINSIGIFGAIFFGSFAIILFFIKIVIGFKNMLENGVNIEYSPSLWILIPILTLLGIMMVRLSFGLNHNFDSNINKSSLFILTSTILSLQIIFGLLGFKIMKINKYFKNFIFNKQNKSSISFALICPGVAFMVFGMFFLNFGLAYNNIVEKYSIYYFILMTPFIFIQYKTIVYFFRLKSKFYI